MVEENKAPTLDGIVFEIFFGAFEWKWNKRLPDFLIKKTLYFAALVDNRNSSAETSLLNSLQTQTLRLGISRPRWVTITSM